MKNLKIIKRLTDAEIIGTGGESNAKPRRTARAILKNNNDLYALMYSGDFDFYSFPGGGVDENESVLSALKREIAEETGCTCDTIEELGIVEENRAYCDYTQVSFYFIVTTNSENFNPSFTDLENQHLTTVAWHTLDETIKLLTMPVYDTPQRKFLQARDIAALDEYLKLLKERNNN